MFNYLYNKKNTYSAIIIFAMLPLISLINLALGVFIGGLLIANAIIAVIVLPQKWIPIFFIGNGSVFLISSLTNTSPTNVKLIQCITFIGSLIIAWIAGKEIGNFINLISKKQEENCQLTTELIHSFVGAIDAKDHYLHNHSYNVCHYTRHISEALNFEPKHIEEVCLAALFHDIGKLSVSEEILNKPSKLDDDEWEIMKSHAANGVNILHNIVALEQIFDYIKYHHRHFDGSGYPADCDKSEVPFESEIIAVADAFDAMTSDRPYRKALSIEVAYDELHKYKGSQFNPDVIDAFFKCQLIPVKINELDIDLSSIF